MPPLRPLCLVLLLLLVLAPAHVDAAAPPPRKVGPAASTLRNAVDGLLARSRSLLEGRDYRGASGFLEKGLRRLRPGLSDYPNLQKDIATTLARVAEQSNARARASAYRAALFRVRRVLTIADASPTGTAEPPGFRLSKDEQALLDLTNKARQKEGLRPLKANAKLFEAARKHSANMARQQHLSHTLDGKNVGDRLREVRYRGFGWGENVATGQSTPSEAIETWLDSPGHRKNMLSRSYREIGLGIAKDEDGGLYWTQVFATPASR
jgi:uncharacterized protein YkwD